MDRVTDLRKSLDELGNSPAMRRGATTRTQAKAAARFAKGGGDDGHTGIPDGFVAADNAFDISQAFEKSMSKAEELGDRVALERLSMASIQWNQAKNKAENSGVPMIMPQRMAALIGYTPNQA
jgi:hypothetical protein